MGILPFAIARGNNPKKPSWESGLEAPLEARGAGAGSGVRGLEDPPASAGSVNSSSYELWRAGLTSKNQWGQGDLNPHNVAVCGF